MAWLGRDRVQRLGNGLEPDVVDHLVVREGDRGDLFGDVEDNVGVRLEQQMSLAVVEPLRVGEQLALRTVPVAQYNHHRLMEPLGYIPAAEAEGAYYGRHRTTADVPVLS